MMLMGVCFSPSMLKCCAHLCPQVVSILAISTEEADGLCLLTEYFVNIIGVSLSKPHIDKFAVEFVYKIYISSFINSKTIHKVLSEPSVIS